MDDQRFQITLLILFLLFTLGFVSLIQNSLNFISQSRLENLNSIKEEKTHKIMKLLENQQQTFISLKILKTILVLAIVFVLYPLTSSYHWSLVLFILFLIIIIFTEILPLTIAKVNPERLMIQVIPIVSFLILLVSPLFWILNVFIKLFEVFFKPEVTNIITEQELLNIVEEAQSEGTLEESDGDLIRRSIEFNDLIVEEILTPRVDLVAVDIEWSLSKIADVISENEFSRYPVYQDTLDKIVGVIHSKDFRNYFDPQFDFKSIINPVTFVPESYKISKLLKQLQINKNHLAVVIDEHGGTAGIVTLEDIIEELVGEIWDEHDDVETEIQKVGENQYVVLGSTELLKLFEFIDDPKDADEIDSSTIGGWVSELMSKIPQISDSIIFENYKFTVLDADEKRVHKLLLEILEKKEDDDEREDTTE